MINPSDKLTHYAFLNDPHISCSPLGCILKRSSQSQVMLDRGKLSVLSVLLTHWMESLKARPWTRTSQLLYTTIWASLIKVDWILSSGTMNFMLIYPADMNIFHRTFDKLGPATDTSTGY